MRKERSCLLVVVIIGTEVVLKLEGLDVLLAAQLAEEHLIHLLQFLLDPLFLLRLLLERNNNEIGGEVI